MSFIPIFFITRKKYVTYAYFCRYSVFKLVLREKNGGMGGYSDFSILLFRNVFYWIRISCQTYKKRLILIILSPLTSSDAFIVCDFFFFSCKSQGYTNVSSTLGWYKKYLEGELGSSDCRTWLWARTSHQMETDKVVIFFLFNKKKKGQIFIFDFFSFTVKANIHPLIFYFLLIFVKMSLFLNG